MRKRILLLVCLIVCIAIVLVQAQEKAAPQADPKAGLKMAAKRGEALWSDASLGTNGQSCASCHADPAELAGVAHTYPKYLKAAKKVVTLDQITNICIVNAMKGTALAWDDQRMADIVTFMAMIHPDKEKMKEPKPEKKMKKAD
jgi:cytochrome c